MTATPGPRPLVHVVGARPNFVKAAPVIRALAEAGVAQRVVHTGQHYDEALSGVFFAELELPAPDLNLGVGLGDAMRARRPPCSSPWRRRSSPSARRSSIDYGDVNSTLAAALVAAKLHLPQAHVEAGLRSFDMEMPEEVNRRVADAFADLCFATSADAVDNLRREGVPAERIHLVGNSMIDSLEVVRPRLDPAAARASVGLPDGPYGVVTLHRPGNVDEPGRTRALVDGLAASAAQVPLVFPVHPRGRAALEAAGLAGVPGLHLVEPLGYLAFLSLLAGAAVAITDSGGVQEETTILGVPCLTVRPNTERPVTITHGHEPPRRTRRAGRGRGGPSWLAGRPRPGDRRSGRRSGTAAPASGSRPSSWSGSATAPRGARRDGANGPPGDAPPPPRRDAGPQLLRGGPARPPPGRDPRRHRPPRRRLLAAPPRRPARGDAGGGPDHPPRRPAPPGIADRDLPRRVLGLPGPGRVRRWRAPTGAAATPWSRSTRRPTSSPSRRCPLRLAGDPAAAWTSTRRPRSSSARAGPARRTR